MCSGFCCGIATVVVGAALVVASSIVGFVFIPNVVQDTIINEVVLLDDTIQMERFEEIPFPLDFKVFLFNISNPDEVVRGAVPIVTEVGPYIYRLHSFRDIEGMQEDMISYRKRDLFEFDVEASFPFTENDVVCVVNIAYHGVLQIVESSFPGLMSLLSQALPGIFGANTEPTVQVQVADLLFNGIRLCENPDFPANVICAAMRQLSDSIQNMDTLNDGTVIFSILGYRNGIPTGLMDAYRGIHNPNDLGRLIAFNQRPYLSNWLGTEYSVCNRINGTDSGIFNPFVERSQSLYALNPDVCRSVEMRYQYDTEYQGIPALRYSANEWFLDGDDDCFCLNVTGGVTRENGCLLPGAMELYSCVGAYMVLSYPHFLYADSRYRNGVIGMRPVEDDHRIFMDIEPNTGVVIRGAKRAQFNVFMRPVQAIVNTLDLRTTLMPLLWVEEGVELPDEFTDEITSELLYSLNLLNILIPVVVAVCCSVLVIGIAATVWIKIKKPTNNV